MLVLEYRRTPDWGWEKVDMISKVSPEAVEGADAR